MELKRLSLSVMVLGAIAGSLSSKAVASGYHFGSQSVSAQGTAHANSAEAKDATTIFYNPAGLGRLEGTHLSGVMTLLVPHSSYSDQNSVTYAKKPTGGGNGGSFAPNIVAAPSFYAARQFSDKINIGVGIFVPFGAKLNYGSTWRGRYGLQNIDLETININPSISYKLNDEHSFGFGLSAQYMSANLKKSVDVKTNALRLFDSTMQAAQRGNTQQLEYLAGLYGYTLAQMAASHSQAQMRQRLNALGDGRAQMSANDWGFGANFGYMYQLNDATRFGLAYRSNIVQKLRGDAYWDYSQLGDRVLANLARNGVLDKRGHDDSRASTRVDTPESVSANAFHQLNGKVALMADVTWTRHSRLKTIDIKFDGTRSGDLVIVQNWRNTYKVALGTNYQHNDKLMWRAGVAYDETPVPNDNVRHPALPDNTRSWLSLGANYNIDKQQSIDMAYSYVFFKDAKVNYTDSCYPGSTTCTGNGETTAGYYKTNMQFVGMQYNYRF